MSGQGPLAWVYSLDDLDYRHDQRRGTPLSAGPTTNDVVFGRRADPASGVSVAMIRKDHPAPHQVSAKAGRVFVGNRRRSVFVANLSTNHPLYVRKWPSAQVVHTLAPTSLGDEDPTPALLGEGNWWIWTTQAADRTPGWILVDVLKPKGRASRLGLRSTASHVQVGEASTDTDPSPETHARPRRTPLDERDVDFLVSTFRQYFTIPPEVRPIPRAQSDADTKATARREAIIKAARPGVKRDFARLYNPDLLPYLFEGDAVLTFSDVQEALVRLGLFD